MESIKPFTYVVIRKNDPVFERETPLITNKYRKSEYAMFNYSVHKDTSESLTHITYCDDLLELTSCSKGFECWFNYPIGLAKSRNGLIYEI